MESKILTCPHCKQPLYGTHIVVNINVLFDFNPIDNTTILRKPYYDTGSILDAKCNLCGEEIVDAVTLHEIREAWENG